MRRFTMLRSDEIILRILLEAKEEGNPLLQGFKIDYPSKVIAQESNSIFVGVVDSESTGEGFTHSTFKDLTEVLIVTKQRDYRKAIKIIKTVSKCIIGLIYENKDKFSAKPVIRNITPEYTNNYVITRGHILIQTLTPPIDFKVDEATITEVCELIVSDNVIEED